jgi:hypothetical protein
MEKEIEPIREEVGCSGDHLVFLDAQGQRRGGSLWMGARLTVATYSDWSEVRSFTTGNPPSVPLLVAPGSNALVTSTTPLLNWNNSTVPAGTTFDKYEVQVSTNNTFTEIVATLNVVGLANSQVNTPALLNAVTYYSLVEHRR